MLKAPRKRQDLNRTNRAGNLSERMKDRQASMDILLEKINPAEKNQTITRAVSFLIIQNEWGKGVKEVPQK